MPKRSTSLGRALGIAIVAPVFTALVAFASTSISACGVGDQYCPDDTIDTDLDDDCPYGPPGGPQEPGESCPTIVFAEEGDPTCADVDFGDVMAVFASGAPGNCTNLACHGSDAAASTAKGVLLTDDSVQTYAELSKYKNSQGEPYLGEGVPRSWILCNLKAAVGGGSPMPVGTPLSGFPEEIATVERWVACGMKPGGGSGPATSSSSSSAGTGGEGGGGTGGEAGEGGAGGGAGGGTGGEG